LEEYFNWNISWSCFVPLNNQYEDSGITVIIAQFHWD
jgi:hypothetical protein